MVDAIEKNMAAITELGDELESVDADAGRFTQRIALAEAALRQLPAYQTQIAELREHIEGADSELAELDSAIESECAAAGAVPDYEAIIARAEADGVLDLIEAKDRLDQVVWKLDEELDNEERDRRRVQRNQLEGIEPITVQTRNILAFRNLPDAKIGLDNLRSLMQN